jgi:hypothetical protein
VTYFDLLGPSERGRRVAARCLFCDSVSGVTVLGQRGYRDGDTALSEYRSLMETAIPLSIASCDEMTLAWLPSNSGLWQPCFAVPLDRGVIVYGEGLAAPAGMPVVTDEGAAIAIVPPVEPDGLAGSVHNPPIAASLPGWMLEVCGRLVL